VFDGIPIALHYTRLASALAPLITSRSMIAS